MGQVLDKLFIGDDTLDDQGLWIKTPFYSYLNTCRERYHDMEEIWNYIWWRLEGWPEVWFWYIQFNWRIWIQESFLGWLEKWQKTCEFSANKYIIYILCISNTRKSELNMFPHVEGDKFKNCSEMWSKLFRVFDKYIHKAKATENSKHLMGLEIWLGSAPLISP